MRRDGLFFLARRTGGEDKIEQARIIPLRSKPDQHQRIARIQSAILDQAIYSNRENLLGPAEISGPPPTKDRHGREGTKTTKRLNGRVPIEVFIAVDIVIC